jgi:Cell division protein CrgA
VPAATPSDDGELTDFAFGTPTDGKRRATAGTSASGKPPRKWIAAKLGNRKLGFAKSGTAKSGAAAKPARRGGRYTAPIPREVRQSPSWYPWLLLGLLIIGLLTIVLNYVNVLPGGTTNGYLIGGIVLIVAGLFMATFYH